VARRGSLNGKMAPAVGFEPTTKRSGLFDVLPLVGRGPGSPLLVAQFGRRRSKAQIPTPPIDWYARTTPRLL